MSTHVRYSIYHSSACRSSQVFLLAESLITPIDIEGKCLNGLLHLNTKIMIFYNKNTMFKFV